MDNERIAKELVRLAKELVSGSWNYRRLPSKGHVEWHQMEKDGVTVDFSYDDGDDSETSVRVDGKPWGKIKFSHPIFDRVDFGDRVPSLSKAAEYVLKKV